MQTVKANTPSGAGWFDTADPLWYSQSNSPMTSFSRIRLQTATYWWWCVPMR